MAYSYYLSGSPARSGSVKESFINDFNKLLSEDFELASDVFTIQEETSFGSNEMQNVTVRINHGISSLNNQKLGDDFKVILFKELDHVVEMGSLFYFDNNYWITYNIEKTKNLATSAMVRRCNNVLRWADENGNVYSEYCAIEYNIKSPTDSISVVDPVEPNGFINVYAQLNSDTRKIKESQRFLFGNTDNWTCFKTFGGGVRNFLNQETTNNTSARLLQLTMGTDYVNSDTDNIVNGIADYYKTLFTFSASPTSYSGRIGDSFILDPNLTRNGIASDAEVSFLSSASLIVSVDEDGIIELLDSGSAIITMWVTNNTSASASIQVASSASALLTYDIRVSPNTGFIYDGSSQIFTVQSYYNGVLQLDEFDFSVSSGSLVPSARYTFSVIDGNNFSVTNNKMYLDNPLVITATSGSLIKDVNIELRGAW